MFDLVLTNGIDDLYLRFKIRNTEIADKWFNELSKDYELYETDRFTNWGDNKYIIDDLNCQIDIINAYEKIIDRKVDDNTTQHVMNYLHKFFENLRGEVDVGTEWYHSAPPEVQSALDRFNVLIHRIESNIRTKNKYPTVVVTFKDRPRFELNENDMSHFTYKWGSGTVYINYCHVGKTVLDAFTDHDDITEAIRPQTHYSADFIIKFGPPTKKIVYFFRSILIKIWIKVKKIDFKNLNIGMIPVADLITEVDKQELVKFNKVKKVVCIK